VDALLHRLDQDPNRLVSVCALDQPPANTQTTTATANAAKGAGPPQHLVKKACVTLGELVAWNVDLRSIPKKALVRVLADHASDEHEASELYLLSSIKGKDRFRVEIEQECTTIMDLLQAYPSSRPPLALLLQVLYMYTHTNMHVCVIHLYLYMCQIHI